MRKLLIGAIAVGCLAFAAVAVAVNNQTIEGSFSPKKLDKKKFKGGALSVTTTTSNADDPDAQPAAALEAKLKFDGKDLRFNADGVKPCKKDLQNTTTESAIALCKKSKVGAGDAEAQLGTVPIDTVVTAFNGKPQGGNPTVLLHSKPEGLPPVILTGELKEGKKKHTLTVEIPALTGGAAITRFYTKVKKGDYVEGRCSDGKIPFSGKFTYDDGTSKKASSTFKCKQA